jgi:hypothetical protein
VVVSALQHGVEVMDALSMSTPRAGRKSVLDLVERVDSVCEMVDGGWCDRFAECGAPEELAASLASVRELVVGAAAGPEELSAVTGLLDVLVGCGSAMLLPPVAVLRAPAAAAGVRLAALEALRALPPVAQSVPDELAAIEAVLAHMTDAFEARSGLQVVSSMALFTLLCRAGVQLVKLGPLDATCNALRRCTHTQWQLLAEDADPGPADLRALSALMICTCHVSYELTAKTPPEGRPRLAKLAGTLFDVYWEWHPQYTATRVQLLMAMAIENRMFEDADISQACGMAFMFGCLAYGWMLVKPAIVEHAAAIGYFGKSMGLLQQVTRACPTALDQRWWDATSAEVSGGPRCIVALHALLLTHATP